MTSRPELEGAQADLLEAATQMTSCLRQGGKLLTFGNGGSAAQAQHLAAEFVGRLTRTRPALPAIALSTDGVMLTSLANDFGFDAVFARQIEAIGEQGDVAIVISTSGASPNAIEGAVAARRLGLDTDRAHRKARQPAAWAGRRADRHPWRHTGTRPGAAVDRLSRPVRDGRGRAVSA